MTPTTVDFETARAEAYKRWYRFGLSSPKILFKRLRNRLVPLFRLKRSWQRARRGWSEADAWSFHDYLAEVIADATAYMRDVSHGYPPDITHEQWLVILSEIEAGMRAAAYQSEHWEWEEGGKAKFDLAMSHLHEWWFDLWD